MIQRRNVLRVVLLVVLAIPLLVACRTAFPLSLSAMGDGQVSVAHVARTLPWQGDFVRDAIVRLEALPASGHDFVRWEGGLSGDANPVQVTMDGPKAITAVFAPSAAIGVSPTEIDFGDVMLGSTHTAVFTVTNTGTAVIAGSATVDAPFAIVPPASYTVGEGESATVTVTFTPADLGEQSAEITFTGGGGTVRPVRGSGVEPTESETVTLEPSAALLAPEATLALALAPTDTVPGDVEWRTTGGRLKVDGATATYTAPATSGTHRVWVASASDPAFGATAWIVVEAATDGFVGRRVAILGDEVLLTAQGATAQLDAVVFENGAPLEGAAVNWASSNSAVSVTQDGLVTAMTDVGSATVTASFGAVSDDRMVPVAQLAEATRLIERGAVLELLVVGDDLEGVVLRRSGDTEGLTAGNVIISSAGILARVLSSRVLADEVVLEVEAATLDEAFDRVSFGGTSEIVELDVTLTHEGAFVTRTDAVTLTPQAYDLGKLECGLTVGRLVDISITGGSIDFSRRIAFTATYEKPWAWSPSTLVLQAEVRARTDISSPVVAIAPGFEGTYACELDITAILVPIVSFFGIVNVGGNLTPKVGFEISGSVDGARVEIGGPSIEGSGYDATLGYRYEDNRSTFIQTVTLEEGTRRMGSFGIEDGPTLAVSMGPYLALGLGTTIDVTTIKGVGVAVATPKLYAQLNLEAAPPFDVTKPTYQGPSWNAELGGAVEFGLELTGNVAKVMKTFGVTVELAKVSVPLFDPLELFASPRLPVTVDREVVRNRVELVTTGLGRAYHGGIVSFYALPPDGTSAMRVATAVVDDDGSATASWTPAPSTDGEYALFATLGEPLFGSLDYPYATPSEDRPTVVVALVELPIAERTLSAAFYQSLAIAADGTPYAWGRDAYGVLGPGVPTYAFVPAVIPMAPAWPRVVRVEAGGTSSSVITDEGSLIAWGTDFDGRQVVTGLPQPDGVADIASGSGHHLVLTRTGELYAWGRNHRGQVGDGTDIDRGHPVRIDGFPEAEYVVAIAAGSAHSLALTSSGALYAWGMNTSGQVGDGTDEDRITPTRVTTLPSGARVASIAAGAAHSMAMLTTGEIYAWGNNDWGQLADGTQFSRLTPVRSDGFPTGLAINFIDVQRDNGIALAADGAVLTWGRTGPATPTIRTGLPDGVAIVGVAAGDAHYLAETASGDVYAWGFNELQHPRVGVGSAQRYFSPTLVLASRPTTARLTVSPTPHGGFLRSDDGAIACASTEPQACEAEYQFAGAGATVPSVVLTPDPWTDHQFARWSGFCDSAYINPCHINMLADRVASGSFMYAPATATLSVTILGGGTVTSDDGRIACTQDGGTCSASYSASAAPRVTLTATPDPNERFTRWTGACTGSSTSCTLVLDTNRTVTASFADERDHELTICDVWSAAQSGGYGTTVDTWDVSMIPTGANFDIRFNAFTLPDKFVVEYPSGVVALDTGWRGSDTYAGDPRYPGGIAGPGQGQVDDVFTRGAQDLFRVTVNGPDPDTAWQYEVRCRQ